MSGSSNDDSALLSPASQQPETSAILISQKRLKTKVLKIDLWYNNSFFPPSSLYRKVFARRGSELRVTKQLECGSIIHALKYTNFIILSFFRRLFCSTPHRKRRRIIATIRKFNHNFIISSTKNIFGWSEKKRRKPGKESRGKLKARAMAGMEIDKVLCGEKQWRKRGMHDIKYVYWVRLRRRTILFLDLPLIGASRACDERVFT